MPCNPITLFDSQVNKLNTWLFICFRFCLIAIIRHTEKYSWDPNTGCVRYQMVKKKVDAKWSGFECHLKPDSHVWKWGKNKIFLIGGFRWPLFICYMYIDLFALQHIADRPGEYRNTLHLFICIKKSKIRQRICTYKYV